MLLVLYCCEKLCFRISPNSRSVMQAEKHRFLKGVVGGLDLTKHEVGKTTIVKLGKDITPFVIFLTIL